MLLSLPRQCKVWQFQLLNAVPTHCRIRVSTDRVSEVDQVSDIVGQPR